MAMLAFHATTKRYGRRTALDALSLEVEPGEIYGFLGPNGAGKTTALHLALGFLKPTAGSGELAGRPFGETRARASVGFVPDAPVFFQGSAMEAMELACTLNGHSFARLRERCRAMLRLLDLPEGRQSAHKFSRGMQQRMALAQAFAPGPPVLLLDEPTSALDPPSVATVRALLAQARGEGTAIFFSSHQLTEVEQLSDRIGFLRGGCLVRTGRLEELLEERATVEIVIRGLAPGSEAATRWGGRPVRNGHGELLFATPVGRERKVIEALWSAGAELVTVSRQRQSLEELFSLFSGGETERSPTENSREPQQLIRSPGEPAQ